MSFHVGQKVVCIADVVKKVNYLGLPIFNKGSVYTIAEIYEVEPYGMLLSTHELGPKVGGQLCGFRPLVERKTSIAVFTAMLDRQKQGEPA